jgi:sugar phosphate isomerase/epimerase
MHRRDLLQTGLAAALSARLLPQAVAQTPAPAAARKLIVDAYSRHLQWLRTPDEVAEAAAEMGYQGLDITVVPYPGHVDPEKVATDLPPYVNAARRQGLRVTSMRCTITDADTPNADNILRTASSLGLTHYWGGMFRYDLNKPIIEQLDALKLRIAKLVPLLEKYNMTAMYHTYSGSASVGAAIWDFLYVLKNFDPKHVGFHYDIGHMTDAGYASWDLNLRAAGPYIAGVSCKDSVIELNLPIEGGGPYTGPPNLGGRGGGAPGGSGGFAGPGGGGRGPAGASGGRGAGGRGGGGAAAGGRGGGAAAGGRGGGGAANPWRIRQVPLGEGIDNLPLLGSILMQMGFNGPIEIQAEYPNGGANNAADKITLPRAQVLGAMKRDLLVLRTAFSQSGWA